MHNSFAESYLTILMWYSHYEFTCLKIQTILKYGCIHTDYKIRNPSTLHFHAFFVCKTVAYIEKRRQNVTPGLFFSCKFIVVYRGFFHCFFFSWKGQGWYMQTQIVHFCLFREYLGARVLYQQGWGGSPSCCCAEVQMLRRLVWGRCWLSSTCMKSLPWADAPRICFVTKTLICLNSLIC